jgi:hypothetical protein
MIEEKWKKIKGINNYLVSNHGRVKSLSRVVRCVVDGVEHKRTVKERILKPIQIHKNLKYVRYVLYKKNYSAHRIVALHFIPNPENKPWINHIDGDPSNNHYTNLEWCTPKENERHSFDVLGKKPWKKGTTVKTDERMKRCIERALIARKEGMYKRCKETYFKYINSGKTMEDVAKEMGVKKYCVFYRIKKLRKELMVY